MIEIDDASALALATPFKMSGESPAADPFPNTPAALLSADHIIEYVEKTGMIAPFDGRSGEKSPLKAASYESKIGNVAFIYERGINYPKTIYNGSQEFLEIPANSIVFVESDIYFRLPPFIAVRFNLQINHVHRGLLLGTGPLVDPGFWGKLCIPLHNLTNEPYHISKDDGLIWIEFTKTSSNPTHGRPPSNTDSPNIKGMIERAAKPIFVDAAPIAIRSSIPDMVEVANKKSEEAAAAAKSAAVDATFAKDDAKGALDQADKMRNYNFYAMIAAAGAVLAVSVAFAAFLTNLSNRNEEIAQQIGEKAETARQSIQQHIGDVDRYGAKSEDARTSVPALRGLVESQQVEIKKLSNEISGLSSEVERLKNNPCNRKLRGIRCP
jgi:deoxycytidine triphosphate deaminase